jgi:hypothetical protein
MSISLSSNPKLEPYLKKEYLKNGYLDIYGSSVIITSLTLVTFMGMFGYNIFLSKLKMLKKEWPIIRCNPFFMPFAGLINAPPNKSKTDYTAENLNNCLTGILKDVVEVETEGIKAGSQVLTKSVGEMNNAMNSLRSLYGNLSLSKGGAFSSLTGKIFNVAIPLNNTVRKVKTALVKSHATLHTGMMVGSGSITTGQSILNVILKAIPVIFVVFVVFIGICIIGIAFASAEGLFGLVALFSFLYLLLRFLIYFIPMVKLAIPVYTTLTEIYANASGATKYSSQYAGTQ